jgi:hypothetical protein
MRSRLQSRLLRLCFVLATIASVAGVLLDPPGSPWGH